MDYKAINKASWNKRTELHFNSDFYDNESFIKGKNSLNDIELNLLGDVSGKKILHLQCHFGQDTISFTRMGAKATGVDLSDAAISKANELAKTVGSDAQFICCDLYDLPNHLDEKFDLVFTSYGTIGWLPDINKWAEVVAHFVKPGGQFLIAEFHPAVWMFDDDFNEVKYRYFNSEPIKETQSGTYGNKESKEEIEYVCWNHGLAEVMQALIDKGIQIEHVQEYDYSPYACFGDNTEEIGERKHQIKKMGNKLPLVYSVLGKKSE